MNIKYILAVTFFLSFSFVSAENLAIRISSKKDNLEIASFREISLSKSYLQITTDKEYGFSRFLTIKVNFEDYKKLSDYTQKHVMKSLEIRLFGVKVSKPILKSKIDNGSIEIMIPNEEDYVKIRKLLKENVETIN